MIVTSILRTTFIFLLLFFLPGYITIRALKLKGLGWTEGPFLAVFSSILLTSWLGLLLAELALFSLWSLLLLLLVYSVGMAVVFRIRPTWGKLARLRLDIRYWLSATQLCCQRWHHLEQVIHDAVVSHLEDGRVGVFVDGHDDI